MQGWDSNNCICQTVLAFVWRTYISITHTLIIWDLISDRGRYYIRYWWIPNLARMASAGIKACVPSLYGVFDHIHKWNFTSQISYRSAIMIWFLWELRNTMKYEHSTKKLDFLLHFGASSLVWFIYLPIVAIVASQVSPLWRYKLLLGMYG